MRGEIFLLKPNENVLNLSTIAMPFAIKDFMLVALSRGCYHFDVNAFRKIGMYEVLKWSQSKNFHCSDCSLIRMGLF